MLLGIIIGFGFWLVVLILDLLEVVHLWNTKESVKDVRSGEIKNMNL
jgi:hypothetical protein